VVPLPTVPETAGCADEQAEEALRHLLALRRADVHSRAGGNRNLFSACRARAQVGRVDPSRRTGTTLPAEVPRLHQVVLGESTIGGNELVEPKNIRLSLPGEKLPGCRSDRRTVLSTTVYIA